MKMAVRDDMNSFGFNLVDYPVGEAVHKAPSGSSDVSRPSFGHADDAVDRAFQFD
jgi:hypothetical protein